MKNAKKWIVPGIIALSLGGLIGAYFSVRSFRYFVQDSLRGFGIVKADMDQVYWCPMHPEVKKKGPGTCPI